MFYPVFHLHSDQNQMAKVIAGQNIVFPALYKRRALRPRRIMERSVLRILSGSPNTE